MTQPTVRRRIAGLVALVSTLGLVGAACAPPGPPPSFSFRADQVTAVENNEYATFPFLGQQFCGLIEILDGCYDEPYLMNIWFRVTIGQPGSAQAGVVSTRSGDGAGLPAICATNRQAPTGICPAGSETATLPSGTGPGKGATVSFGPLPNPDIIDLGNGAPLTIAGVWSWSMEQDLLAVSGANELAAILRTVLNDILAAGTVPSDPEEITQLVVDLLGDALAIGGGLLLNAITNALGGDDLLGSRMYVFVGSSGVLADIIDNVVPDLGGFELGISNAGIPDVLGISVRSTKARTINNQVFDRDGSHRYRFVTSNS